MLEIQSNGRIGKGSNKIAVKEITEKVNGIRGREVKQKRDEWLQTEKYRN